MRKKYVISVFLLLSIILLVIIAVSFIVYPPETTLTEEQKMMKIAIAYIEENCGNDYVVEGEVTNRSVTEDDVVYNYPAVSLRYLQTNLKQYSGLMYQLTWTQKR
jgi:hypothetical protein